MSNALDGLARIGRHLFHGSRVQGWPITSWVYGRMMRFTQRREATNGELDIRFRGAQLWCSASDVTITPTLRDGTYEREELDAWLGLLRPGATVIDVGANVGAFALLSSRVVGPGGRVIAFEPEPTNADRLRRNVSRNGARNVEVRQEAVGDAPGEATLYVQPGQSGTHSMLRPDGAEGIAVPITTLDDLIIHGRPDAIKIDVEGLEGAVLRGGHRMLRDAFPHVLLEYNGGDATAAIESLMAAGYDDCIFLTRRGRRPLTPELLQQVHERATYGNILLSRRRTPPG